MLEPEGRSSHAFARMFEREKRFLLSLTGQHKKIAGLGAIELIEEGTRPAGKLRCVNSCVRGDRSEEHTSELQSHSDLVCRLLLEKKKKKKKNSIVEGIEKTNISS